MVAFFPAHPSIFTMRISENPLPEGLHLHLRLQEIPADHGQLRAGG